MKLFSQEVGNEYFQMLSWLQEREQEKGRRRGHRTRVLAAVGFRRGLPWLLQSVPFAIKGDANSSAAWIIGEGWKVWENV